MSTRLENACISYFNGWNELLNNRNVLKQRIIGGLKVASLATLIIPLVFGVAFITSRVLQGRVKTGTTNATSTKTNSTAQQTLNPPPPTPLEKLIRHHKNHLDVVLQTKAALFENATNLYKENKCKDILKVYQIPLQEAKDEIQSLPAIIDAPFQLGYEISDQNYSPYFYNYIPSDVSYEDVWVDFANSSLGGGCFGHHGFVQEEIMVAEMPDFADHIAKHCDANGRNCTLRTRVTTSVPSPTPTPILLKGLHRVQSVRVSPSEYNTIKDKYEPDFKGFYGQGIKKFDLAKRPLSDIVENLKSPVVVNVLAMAAPNLSPMTNGQPDLVVKTWQTKFEICLDLFHTAKEGFRLAKEKGEPGKEVVIHSGKFGAGVFKNDPIVVGLVQYMAAQFVGVHLKLYGYSGKEIKEINKAMKYMKTNLITGSTIEDHLRAIPTAIFS